jgi:hypothetical protein
MFGADVSSNARQIFDKQLEAKKAVRTAPKRKRLKGNKLQFIKRSEFTRGTVTTLARICKDAV